MTPQLDRNTSSERPMDDRDKVALRLLGSSAKNSYDPMLDIDWDAPVADGWPYMPLERVSLYGTALWDEMTRGAADRAVEAGDGEHRRDRTVVRDHPGAMLARYAYHQDPQAPHTQYALTEIGDETRHIIMFAKAISRIGVSDLPAARDTCINSPGCTRRPRVDRPLFAPVLVAEEVTDRLQRVDHE